jgi:hypothetical protein
MTLKPTPEELMAYADGQLDAEQARRIKQALALHPVLRVVVEDHKRTRAAARVAFDEMTAAPMSPGLAKLAHALEAPQAAPRKVSARTPSARKAIPAMAWPAAAAACLVAGVVSAMLVAGNNDGLIRWRDGPSAGTVLARVLETRPSGEASGNAIVVASFKAVDGRYCRQFEIGLEASGAVADGVACRGEDRWNVIALARRPGAASSYMVAGGGDPVALAVAGLGPGPRIAADAERALIGKEWKD